MDGGFVIHVEAKVGMPIPPLAPDDESSPGLDPQDLGRNEEEDGLPETRTYAAAELEPDLSTEIEPDPEPEPEPQRSPCEDLGETRTYAAAEAAFDGDEEEEQVSGVFAIVAGSRQGKHFTEDTKGRRR